MSEAVVFARYLVGKDPTDRVAELYDVAVRQLGYGEFDGAVDFALQHPWTIGMLDGALALVQPDAMLRRKLLLMTALLETSTAFCDDFLPRDRPAFDLVRVGFASARGAFQALAGLLLLPFVR